MAVKCCRLCASSALQLEPVDFWALQASDGGDFDELCEINFHHIEVDINTHLTLIKYVWEILCNLENKFYVLT